MKGLSYNSQGSRPKVIANVDLEMAPGTLQNNQGGSLGVSTLSGASIAGTLTRLDSGKTFLFNHADGGTYTLPALERNLRFDFKVMVVPTNGNQVVASAGSLDDINGGAVVNGAAVVADAEDNINFIASTCLIGDQVSLFCDGTQWIVNGVSNYAGGITFT